MGFLSLFFPDRCVLCGEPVPSGELCCQLCEAETPPAGAPSPGLGTLCQNLAVFRYDGHVRRAVHRMKYDGDLRAAAYFAGRMASLLRQELPGLPFDLITYVPMQEVREKERGYNQARVLADLISRDTGIPVSDGLLRREGAFIQHQLAVPFRKKSAKVSFLPQEDAVLAGGRILLVDDVVTTGSTAAACVNILTELGAKTVVVLSCAR